MVPTALDEAESKRLVREFGVPVVPEIVASDAAGAEAAAGRLGFPVVLKALGRRLLHKSDRGLVCLGLTTRSAVREAAAAIAAGAGPDLEGFLVQAQRAGRRELVAGMVRDPRFGPVVMFGLGGVLTEALSDVTFGLVPLDRADALAMLDGIRAKRLLGAVRGEAAADREALAAALVGLSRLALARPDVAEVDLNPLIVGPDGSVAAVDALVVLDPERARPAPQPHPEPAQVAALLHPRSVAFVGASGTFGKWGHLLPTNVIAGGYAGGIHLVNARGGTIAGRPVFRSPADIPGPVDLAVVTLPAAEVAPLIPALVAKGVRGMLVISSGFSETSAEGRLLEVALTEQARANGLIFIGPNTMGISNPHLHFDCTAVHVHPEAGGTVLIAQSGNLGVQLLAFAAQQGLGIRAFCGSGNEAMVTIEDFLEAFEEAASRWWCSRAGGPRPAAAPPRATPGRWRPTRASSRPPAGRPA